jgi:hypothetical protein
MRCELIAQRIKERNRTVKMAIVRLLLYINRLIAYQKERRRSKTIVM